MGSKLSTRMLGTLGFLTTIISLACISATATAQSQDIWEGLRQRHDGEPIPPSISLTYLNDMEQYEFHTIREGRVPIKKKIIGGCPLIQVHINKSPEFVITREYLWRMSTDSLIPLVEEKCGHSTFSVNVVYDFIYTEDKGLTYSIGEAGSGAEAPVAATFKVDPHCGFPQKAAFVPTIYGLQGRLVDHSDYDRPLSASIINKLQCYDNISKAEAERLLDQSYRDFPPLPFAEMYELSANRIQRWKDERERLRAAEMERAAQQNAEWFAKSRMEKVLTIAALFGPVVEDLQCNTAKHELNEAPWYCEE